eukprot:scaffold11813_cov61-Attheya_sp.AAC.2
MTRTTIVFSSIFLQYIKKEELVMVICHVTCFLDEEKKSPYFKPMLLLPARQMPLQLFRSD